MSLTRKLIRTQNKSKYSSDMFYDWKFSEMVHPASALMTDMFSCILFMFFFSKEHPDMFLIDYKYKYNSDMFYDWNFLETVYSGSVMMACIFSVFCACFAMFFPYQNPPVKAAFHQNIPLVIILIFLLQILRYKYSEPPSNVKIYFWFFQKISASIRGAEDDGWASHVLDDLWFFGASG